MLTPDEFDTFTDAYVAVLRRIHDHPEYETTGRGKDGLEVPNISFRLTDPTRRTPWLAARRVNIAFNYAELLWYVGCRAERRRLQGRTGRRGGEGLPLVARRSAAAGCAAPTRPDSPFELMFYSMGGLRRLADTASVPRSGIRRT